MAEQVRIGDVLIAEGYLSPAQLDEALELQKQDRSKRLGEILLDYEYITEDQLLVALSKRLNLEIADFTQIEADLEAAALVPKALAVRYRILPLGFKGGRALLVVNDPLDVYGIEDIKALMGVPAELLLGKKEELLTALNKAYGELDSRRAIEAANMSVAREEGDGDQDVAAGDDTAPIVNLINSIIIKGYNDSASDIHIDPFEKSILIRYRIDGLLIDHMTLDSKLSQNLSARLKIMAGMDIAESRMPQDGHFKIRLQGAEVNIRVSTMPTVFGETIVLRFLTQLVKIDHAAHYGMDQENYRKITRILGKPHGILLITGPTGSGKTTTLYMLIESLLDRPINICTIEDPVEKNIPKVNQMQVNLPAGLTFETGLKALLRQDPDVILVGEIRDGRTAETAVTAAVTGHFVLSTLHTNDAVSTITRLLDLDVQNYMIASSVVGVVSQRLVKKICPHCREAYAPSEEELEYMPEAQTLWKGKGCHNCDYTGYRGRLAVHEILEVDSAIRKMISRKEPIENIYDYVSQKGRLVPMGDAVKKLVLEGITTSAELMDHASMIR